MLFIPHGKCPKNKLIPNPRIAGCFLHYPASQKEMKYKVINPSDVPLHSTAHPANNECSHSSNNRKIKSLFSENGDAKHILKNQKTFIL